MLFGEDWKLRKVSPRLMILLHRLLESATRRTTRRGLIEALEIIATHFVADGVVIWREAPMSDLAGSDPQGRLFAFADWTKKEEYYHSHNVPLASATGRAILINRPEYIAYVDAPDIYRKDGYLSIANIETFTIHPFLFKDGKAGSINFYFEKKRALSQAQYEEASEISKFIPEIIEVFRTGSAHDVLGGVNRILDRRVDESITSYRLHLRECCLRIAKYLQAAEVSIFLSDPERKRNVFDLAATTWLEQLPFPKKQYSGRADEGLTGWVLEHKKHLNLFDLADFERIQEDLKATHPGLVWNDSLLIRQGLKRILGKNSQRAKQVPLTFLAVPIQLGDRLFGVLRVCTSVRSPYYFGEMECELLNLIANEIAQSWEGWTSRASLLQEVKSWEEFATGLDSLSKLIEAYVREDDPGETLICERALRIADEVVNDQVVSDIRKVSPSGSELEFSVVFGEGWDQGTKEQVQKRLSRTFSTEGEPKSLGAKVVQTSCTQVIEDVDSAELPYSPTFGAGKWIVSAPITVEEETIGVLDLRGTGERIYPRQAKPVAELLANQLGMYFYLAKTVRQLKAQPRQLAQSYEDFYHQLKTPVNLALARAKSSVAKVLKQAQFDEKTERDLHAVRGLTAKTKAVTESLGVFAMLAQGKELSLQIRSLDADFIKTLIEMVSDAELLSDPDQNLSFRLDRQAFTDFHWPTLKVDRPLLLQCLLNLLDNADKYSYPNTIVRLNGGITKTGRFRFSVENEGIELRGKEKDRARVREWRGEEARSSATSGSGIGLWVVDEIMKSHGGELHIQGTNIHGVTIVELFFPLD